MNSLVSLGVGIPAGALDALLRVPSPCAAVGAVVGRHGTVIGEQGVAHLLRL